MTKLSPFLPVVGLPACTRMGEHSPFHGVGSKYVNAVAEGAGALPVLLPALGERYPVEAACEALDGILFTGSPSNVEPQFYGGPASEPGTVHDAARDATTLPLIRAAIQRGVPIFCICRGIQELNVALGGTLHQRVQDVPGLMDHREPKAAPFDEQYAPRHTVRFKPGSVFETWAGGPQTEVNSLHGQGINRLADGLEALAHAPDGVVEAFAVKGARTFAYAVQFHPEWRCWETPFYAAIFEAFGHACRQRRSLRLQAADLARHTS